jgi:hypothetical protein
MHIRRGLALLSVLSFGAFFVNACGDDETTNDDSGPSTSTQSVSSTSTGGSGPGGSGPGGMGGAPPMGNGTCGSPFPLAAPSMTMNTTVGAPDEQQSPCLEGPTGEHAYVLTPTESGVISITLTPTMGTDLGLFVRRVCGDPNSITHCAVSPDVGQPTELALGVIGGETYYLFVDGYSAGQEGPYTLDVSAVAVETMCGDMMDNNDDGLVDCEDPGCFADAACAGIMTECTGPTALTPGTPQTGDTVGGTNLFAGTCTGAGLALEQLYSYTPTADAVLSLTLATATDQGLYVRSACADPLSQLSCTDVEVGGTDEVLHTLTTGGQALTVFVDGFTLGEEGPFTLSSQVTNIDETEPNNDYMTANAYMPAWTAFISPSGDQDFVSIAVAANADLVVSTDDVLAGDCANRRIDTEVQILGPDGMTEVAFNDDIDPDPSTGNFCSNVTAPNLAAGTYYVRVGASAEFCSSCRMPYTLTIVSN